MNLIIKSVNQCDEQILKRSTYLCLNKILFKLEFRRVNYSLEIQIKEILTMLLFNITHFNDVVFHYYFGLIVRKVLTQYEIGSDAPVIEELQEVFSYSD